MDKRAEYLRPGDIVIGFEDTETTILTVSRVSINYRLENKEDVSIVFSFDKREYIYDKLDRFKILDRDEKLIVTRNGNTVEKLEKNTDTSDLRA